MEELYHPGGLHEECGVFGVWDPTGDCARQTYYGLYALQHRGQESCGIAAKTDREITCYKNMGLVGDVFDQQTLDRLGGTMAIGHVRYSTTGGSQVMNAQPMTLKYVKNQLALAHNGNLVNTNSLRRQYELSGAIFQTTADTEIIAYSIARERLQCRSVEEAVVRAMRKLVGSFSLVVMSARKLIAARDPWGFRPLCMGRRGDAILFASESCALESVGAELVRDVEPGEVIVVEDGQIRSIRDNCRGEHHLCIFEYIYFARQDSVIDGQCVHDARLAAGRLLAQQMPVEADLVFGVPDSGIDAAMGYAAESGIPYGQGFVKNRYVGRTFIKPDQRSREMAVRVKLSALRGAVEGKRVIMVDDSIVRGTTSGTIIRLLREAGAKEVHVKISSPPFISPCYFGTDVPDKDQLMACHHSVDEICRIIGADSLDYLSLDNLEKIAPMCTGGFCKGCFTGTYPVNVADEMQEL
jgi:amidophosphoribosyltransferase